MGLYGADLSSYNGIIDWTIFKNNFNFMLTRSSWGTTGFDVTYTTNKDTARNLGILIGLYHTVEPKQNPAEAEATQFAKTIADLRVGENVAIDFEYQYDIRQWTVDFVNKLRTFFPNINGYIYCNGDGYDANQGFPELINMGWKVWIADNNGKPDGASRPCDLHQYALDIQAVETESKLIDLDYYYRDEVSWKAFGYQPTTPVDPCKECEDKLKASQDEVLKLQTKLDNISKIINSP